MVQTVRLTMDILSCSTRWPMSLFCWSCRFTSLSWRRGRFSWSGLSGRPYFAVAVRAGWFMFLLFGSSKSCDACSGFAGRAVYTGTRPGLTPAIRAGKGLRGRRELAPRCSVTQLAARRHDPGQTRRVLNHLNHTHYTKTYTPHHARMLGHMHGGQPSMILHSIKICNICNVCNFMRIYCFWNHQIRNIRNLMRIYCFGINLIFVTVFVSARMVSRSLAGWSQLRTADRCIVQSRRGVGPVRTLLEAVL